MNKFLLLSVLLALTAGAVDSIAAAEQGAKRGKAVARAKRHKCRYCKYRAAQQSTVIIHERTHTGEKPFKCTYCEYRAARQDYLTMHELTHTGEKPFPCEHCGYRAIQKSNLKRHIRKMHSGQAGGASGAAAEPVVSVVPQKHKKHKKQIGGASGAATSSKGKSQKRRPTDSAIRHDEDDADDGSSAFDNNGSGEGTQAHKKARVDDSTGVAALGNDESHVLFADHAEFEKFYLHGFVGDLSGGDRTL